MRKRILLFILVITTSVAYADEQVKVIEKNGMINVVKKFINENGEESYYTEYLGTGEPDDPKVHNPPPKKEDVVFVRAKQVERPEFTEEEPLPDPNVPVEKQRDFLQRKKEFEERKNAFFNSENTN